MMTVILCINRSTPFLKAAIRSVLDQDDGDFLFLIGANACEDELIEEIEQIVAGDPRVRIVRSGVPQLSYNLNSLVDIAETEWLIRMDGDDISEPTRIRHFRALMARTEADVIGSWATFIDEHDREIGLFKPEITHERIRSAFRFRNQLCHPAVAFKKSYWLEMRGYLGGFVSEDLDFWLRGFAAGKRFANIPQPLLRYRIHGAQASRSRRGYAEAAAHWYRQLLQRPSWFNLVGWVVATGKLLIKARR